MERFFERRIRPEHEDDDERTVVKILSTGEDFEKSIENRREHAPDERAVFGADLLETWETVNGFKVDIIGSLGADQRERLGKSRGKMFADEFARTKADLIRMAKLEREDKNMETGGLAPVRDLFLEYLEHFPDPAEAAVGLGVDEREAKAIAAETRNDGPDEEVDPEEDGDFERFRAAFALAKRISMRISEGDADFLSIGKDSAFPKVLAVHREVAENKEARLAEMAPDIKAKFTRAVLQAIDAGFVPMDKKVAQERLATVAIRPLDALCARSLDIDGRYQPGEHVVEVALQAVNNERMERALQHELTHSLSGRSDKGVFVEDSEDPDLYQTGRIGLFMQPESRLLPELRQVDAVTPRLYWLNEALTETIAMYLGKRKRSVSYRPERALLERIMSVGGIEPSVFMEAYFENYGESDRETMTPKLRRMFDETDRAFGQRFLTDLDIFIRAFNPRGVRDGDDPNGAMEALRIWDEEGERFPQRIREMADDLRRSRE